MRGSLISSAYLNYLLRHNNPIKLLNVVLTNHHIEEKEEQKLNKKCLIHQKQELLNLYDLSTMLAPVPYKIPTQQQFDSYIRFRFDHQTPIVLFDETIHLASRAWFTFRYFGFQRVYILDGGYHHWHKHQAKEESFEGLQNCKYTHNLLEDLLKDKFEIINTNDVQLISYLKTQKDPKGDEYEILDARDKPRFDQGHIPGSINIEFTEYLNSDLTMKSDQELKDLYAKHNIDLSKKLINTCQTGKLATIAIMAQELLKKKQAILYDGSYTDYQIEHPHK